MVNKKTKIVGFQSGHDVSYCILENGIPIVHNEWERFCRKKEVIGDGLKFFFDMESGEGVDYFTHGNYLGRQDRHMSMMQPDSGIYPTFDSDADQKMRSSGAEYYEFSHHLSHAANAFFSSNHSEALIITIDGGGNEVDDGPTAITVWTGKDNKITKRHVYPLQQINIGNLWSTVTKGLGLSWGYPGGNAAGTVMAMAACGEVIPSLVDQFKQSLNGNIKFTTQGNPDDIAASLQKATEDVIHDLVSLWLAKYPHKYLCLAGGVALNSVTVGKLYEAFHQLEDIYVPPVPFDGGLAIGSAQYLWHHVLDNPRITWKDNFSPYLGTPYSKSDIMSSLQEAEVNYTEVSDDQVIDLLCKDDNVISVFGGGSESGKRALGDRSILADPRSKTMKGVINDKVKHRESFRPFAPSILREDVSDWFERDVNSPYMTAVIKFREEVADKVPAVCHVDNSARLQTVTEKDNPWYHGFISKFKNKTGVPILLNTSFNDREPIVETPTHAINCFLKTNIDYLYFYDVGILVTK
jgi:carbamoyltransferase